MSVGHSRRTSRSSSPSASGCAASSTWRSGSTPSFSSPAASPISCVDVAEHLDDADLEPVLGLAGPLADDEPLERLALDLDRGRRRHPVQRLVSTRVGVDQHRAVRLDHQQPRRLRQERRQAARVGHFAAADDEAHDARTVLSVSDMSRGRRGQEIGSRRTCEIRPTHRGHRMRCSVAHGDPANLSVVPSAGAVTRCQESGGRCDASIRCRGRRSRAAAAPPRSGFAGRNRSRAGVRMPRG